MTYRSLGDLARNDPGRYHDDFGYESTDDLERLYAEDAIPEKREESVREEKRILCPGCRLALPRVGGRCSFCHCEEIDQ